MIIRFVLVLCILAASLGGLFYWKWQQEKAQLAASASFSMPPVSVEADVARAEQRVAARRGIGTLVAVNGLDLKAETAGRIERLHFESGGDVAADDLLVALDDREEQAQLQALEAQLELSRLAYERGQKLRKRQSIADSEVDERRAELRKAKAEITRLQAVIDKKQIRAPFAGRIGIRRVNLGEYLEKGQEIASLQALDPIYARFSLPEKDSPVLAPGLEVEVLLDAFPDEVFRGTISALDTQVNAQTRNLVVQATLPNADKRLLPGMFAKTRVILPSRADVVTIPETAINYSLYGDSVFVIQPGEGETPATVKRRYVTPGLVEAGRVAIAEGLAEGEMIVAAGGLKLRDGATVQIKATPDPTGSEDERTPAATN